MGRKQSKPALSLITQRIGLLGDFPESTCTVMKGELVWTGFLQPSNLSANYTVRMVYKLGKRPRVSVLDPTLERYEGKALPHVYTGNVLCVYTPWNQEWTEDQRLVDTIIPWTSEWLLHYEFWLITGVWHGGGTHPQRYNKAAKNNP